MADKPLGVLVHGAGWVSSQHLAAYARNRATQVVAISSRSLRSARRRADEAGLALAHIGLYQDLDAALQHPGVDAVSICTPQHLHCQNVLAVAAAGKHMVIEKPVGISAAQLQQMRDAVRAAGVKTVVSFVLRWNPLLQTLKRMTAAGALGRTYYVEADYLSYNGSWWSGWNDARTVEQGVSAMLVGGCHAVDAVRWLAGGGEFEAASPVEVFAVSGGQRKESRREYNPLTNTFSEDAPPMEYDGLEVALVKFENGVVGKVTVNAECIMPYRFPIRIFGDRGSVLDNRLWSLEQSNWTELEAVPPDSASVSQHPFQAEIDHFVQCVNNDVESHCNLDDACKTHEIVFAAQECYATGRPVALPRT